MNVISKKSTKNISKKQPIDCKVNLVTQNLHSDSECRNMGWYNIYLPKQQGQSNFRCFNISKEIYFTKSYYYGKEPLFSKSNYLYDTTLMIFGLKGKSHLGFSATQLNHTISAGDIWLFNLHHLHNPALYRLSTPNLRHEMAVLKFPTERLKRAFSANDKQLMSIFNLEVSHVAIQQDNDEWIAPLVENPLRTPFDRIKAEGRALELISHWLLPLGQYISITSKNHSDPCCYQSTAVEKAREILIAELTNPPTLYDLAKQVGMSHTRLNQNFKRNYGKTVFDWLRGYRLQLAKTYLQDRQYSITFIAHLCGFSSTSHFIQTFRQHEGCTPVTYRTNYLSKEVYHVD
ncbi:helix-turn-helix transcriptional regulator [Xenorhabdus thuongxuanensis]|uniref:Transcriptional regulator PchR n=1 Tax=Xenorhabdus thuongxuanensis TaxID=1873484 RepID=A0A1Q5U316_9GAMM|nr:AraC family transcriptional regulator [Xenorhabdus thuongxuanensis]OKP06863.1 transcriptional regulator PchR [Xenorhabdus thuongxuanensis]